MTDTVWKRLYLKVYFKVTGRIGRTKRLADQAFRRTAYLEANLVARIVDLEMRLAAIEELFEPVDVEPMPTDVRQRLEKVLEEMTRTGESETKQ